MKLDETVQHLLIRVSTFRWRRTFRPLDFSPGDEDYGRGWVRVNGIDLNHESGLTTRSIVPHANYRYQISPLPRLRTSPSCRSGPNVPCSPFRSWVGARRTKVGLSGHTRPFSTGTYLSVWTFLVNELDPPSCITLGPFRRRARDEPLKPW